MNNIEIKIDPSEHKGWTLKYAEQHDLEHNWSATKGIGYLFADTPKNLILAIDEREKITVRLKPPIKVLYKGQYDNAFQPADVHTVANNVVYIRGSNGKEETTFLDSLRPGNKDQYGCGILIHDCKENRKLLNEGIQLRREAADLTKKAEELVRRVKRVTDADVLIAAKGKS
jgi:hypothetical protein